MLPPWGSSSHCPGLRTSEATDSGVQKEGGPARTPANTCSPWLPCSAARLRT